VYTKKKTGSAAETPEPEPQKAKKEADLLEIHAKTEAVKVAEEAKREEEKQRRDIKETERRLQKHEESIDRKLEELDTRNEKLRSSEDQLEKIKDEVRAIRTNAQEELKKIAKLSKQEAAERLMQMTEKDIKKDLEGLVAKLQRDAAE